MGLSFMSQESWVPPRAGHPNFPPGGAPPIWAGFGEGLSV